MCLVDKRTDIWAFGVVLFEMLSGQRAFSGDTTVKVLSNVLKTEPDFDALPSNTPPLVRRLLKRCLDKDVRRRLRDIADARIDLEDAPAAPGTLDLGSARQATSRTRRVALVAIAAIALMLAGAFGVWPLKQKDGLANSGTIQM
jgi:serine/threonine protein kinase